ncbi:AAA family ATPase [Dorea formicigenerans]|jgi:hypothetical protein|uniref:AAA family ATPase n=1 Tax=Dorea formicigenerans TaxID=39486 RepID=UPI000E435D85|nr:AAA family ATPase [Dorea formicigenerans]RGJ64379.1 hypothetical protein DXD50_08840 [Dorea formicigenerans]
MNIIFLWNSKLDSEQNKGVMLSGKYDVSFKLVEKSIIIKRNQEYIRNFWGKNILDCFAIVGENGAGKTKLVNDIMYTIRDAKFFEKNYENFLLIYEDNSSNELIFVCTDNFKDWTIDAEENITYQLITSTNNTLKNYEVAYFHNALNVNDYLAQARCKYDFSLANQMYKHRSTTYEMHYDDISKDTVMNFYENETFRIISFLYDFALHNELKIDFPVPRYITIGIADEYYSEHYILGQAKGLRVDRGEEEKLSEDIQNFSNGVDNIVRVYGRTWINYTIKNLIYNVFKELCIPTTTPSNITYSHQNFFDACSFLRNAKKLAEMSVYQCVYKVINNLRRRFVEESSYIDNFERYVQWMEANNDQIIAYENKGLVQLYIYVEKSTEEFIAQLICLYSKVNFAFPFYKFSFGVSTGEYYFLSIYSNLYSICNSKGKNINVYDGSKPSKNVKSMLLIFDEADLSLHPKWQRMFMKWLTDFCEHVFKDITIKIVVTTHSPILLSDFPGNSVLYIKKLNNKMIFCNSDQKNTFGCNIHSLFLNSFFLEKYGTMGALAEEKINKVAEKINKGEIEQESLLEIEKTINYIGEGIIKNKLEAALRKKSQKKKIVVDESEKTVIQETILQLKRQKIYLEQMIANLEETINDKN